MFGPHATRFLHSNPFRNMAEVPRWSGYRILHLEGDGTSQLPMKGLAAKLTAEAINSDPKMWFVLGYDLRSA